MSDTPVKSRASQTAALNALCDTVEAVHQAVASLSADVETLSGTVRDAADRARADCPACKALIAVVERQSQMLLNMVESNAQPRRIPATELLRATLPADETATLDPNAPPPGYEPNPDSFDGFDAIQPRPEGTAE